MKALLVLATVAGVISAESPHRTSKGLQQMVDNRNLFSPRMEYDEWTPLGRGDPLKNDPTYDYVPPVLERVHYWMDPSKRTPDPPSLDPGLLVLGSSSRTEPTLASQRVTTPKHADSRLDTASILDPFLKLVDVSKFGLNLGSGTGNYYKQPTSSNRIHPMNYQRPPPHHQYNSQRYRPPPPPPPQALQRPPYAMLVPPPPPPPTPFTPSSATFATITTTAEPAKTPVYLETTTVTLTTMKSDVNATTALPTTALTDTENVYKPVAIDMPEDETIRNDVAKNQESQHDEEKETNYVKKPAPPKEQKYRPSERENNRKRPQQRPAQPSKLSKPVNQKEKWFATTVRPPTTTRTPDVLTTDPMFKHYKQPSEPIKGPFYLIIQGHSKVKTYGASKNPVNGLLASNEIRAEDGDDSGKRKTAKSGRWVSALQELRPDRKKRFEAWTDATAGTPAISELSAIDADVLDAGLGKSESGASRKRYLPDPGTAPLRSRRYAGSTPQTMITVSGKPTPSSESVDVESFIALNDDYAPEDVVSLLLKEEGQGSGLGNFLVSIFGRSVKDEAA